MIALTASFSRLVSGTLQTFLILILFTIKGNPFSPHFANNKTLRIIIVFYLPACAVISNGYKNTNVYKMIKSREVLAYEKLSELVKANFSIYLRASLIQFGFLANKFAAVDPNFILTLITFTCLLVDYLHMLKSFQKFSYFIASWHKNDVNTSVDSQGKCLTSVHHTKQLHPMLPFSVLSVVARIPFIMKWE